MNRTSTDFVNGLRARRGLTRLAPADATRVMTIRAQVAEAWEAIRLEVSSDTTAAEVRREALRQLYAGFGDEDAFDIKYLGALVDGSATMESAGVVEGGLILIIHRRRRPVR